ncbi:Quinoprotein glucose dehydrogenase B precursor [Lacunisphaera limnophila]|uniref:Quinoprotein glucose dehydrogenase B n=2 Tax=Lacunisphaera limnophila TaxID=1838286 RepID=A0A1D8AUC9_9BACT|nr:Quinoprotein glucose dehydrogenase B precursor [Lacunisphaera limnophila]
MPVILVLALLNLAPTLAAAETSGATAARGQLAAEDRRPEPVIEAASDEARLALGRMQLPPGLTAHLWAAEPMFGNPVAFNLDALGRVFVSETHRYGSSTLDIRGYMWTLEDDLANRNQDDWLASVTRHFGPEGVKQLSIESERLVLLEDSDGDGTADKSSVYADNFRSPLDGVASGVLAHRGDVWFTNIPALWKFTGKDKAETRTEVFRGFGVRFNFTGHDLHGLTLGPDGRIYFSIGDRGASVPTKEGGRVETPDTGAVFRCWPDGSGLELFANGLRNPQSLAFNEFGDLFTGDNDSDQGDEERLVHVVEGGDSGWRVGYQFAPRGNAGPWNTEKLWHPRHAGQPAYLVPPICNIEDGPSGIAYYPGTGLTPAYAGHLFITHFKGAISNSGIFSYKLKPAGASYAVETAAPFLTGALPTDVRFGPDGKLYYSDWAEGWPKSKKGRIYTIADPTRANDPALKAIQALIGSDFTKKSDDELAALLAHADWRVRLEAQYTLAERGTTGVTRFATALSGASELARRHAVWGLGQLARQDAAVLPVLRPLLQHADPEIRAQAAKTLGDLRDAAAANALVAALADESLRVQFFAAEALGKIQVAAATPALIAAVRANADTDATLRHALTLSLARCATTEALAALASDDSAPVRLAAVLALRRLQSAHLALFLADREPAVVREAALAINDAPVPAAYAALAGLTGQRINDEAVLLRALNAHFRLGTAENAAALATFAARGGSPAIREEALVLLSLWPAPPARDRLVGIYRPLAEKTRPAEVATAALLPVLDGLFGASVPDSVQLAALKAISSLGLKDAVPALTAVVADPAQSASVRSAALKALDGFDAPGLMASAQLAAASDLPDLRLAALPVISRLQPAQAVAVLAALVERGTTREQQTAFRALGDAKDPAADELLLAQLTLLAAGRIPAAAQLDLLDAAALRADPRIKQVLATREAALAADPDPLAPFRVALEGGDAVKSRPIFASHPVMQCMRCHRIGEYGGGDAGPDLAGIGARESREYLLESIIKPSAKIAAGFEIVSVTRQNGESIVGTLLQRDARGVRLKTAEQDSLEIPAAEVKSVESAPSAMPEIAALVLTKAEIRDLVAGLASLTEPAKPRGQATLRALRGR